MVRVDVADAGKRLAELVQRALAGEVVVIGIGGDDAVTLMPITHGGTGLESVRGMWRGRVRVADDFDQLPEDVARAFGVQ